MSRGNALPFLGALVPLTVVLIELVRKDQMEIGLAGLLWLCAVVGMLMLLGVAGLRSRAVDEAAESLLQTTGAPSSPGTPTLEKLDRFARNWQQERSALERLLDSRKTVLDLLPDPYLMIDAQSRIVRTNRAGLVLFGEGIEERSLSAAIREPAILDAVNACMTRETTEELEWVLSRPEERFFRVTIEPVPVQPHVRTRLILAFSDMTAARRSQRSNTDFVANASHELRTPLTSLIGFIETLQGPAYDDQKARDEFLGIMHDQASRMARLVQDLLSLSRIERILHERPVDRVNLGDVLSRAAQTLTPQAARHQMQITATIDEPVYVQGDSDELAQMCLNLLDNAIKYGAAGTEIRTELRIAGGQGLLSVLNQGDGIAPEDIPRLTERFFRSSHTRHSNDTGTGLGLAIVQNIITRHRGHLQIESTLGSHSRFTVTLPMSGPA